MVISVSSHSLDEDGPETVDTETSAAPAGLSGFVFRANVNGFSEYGDGQLSFHCGTFHCAFFCSRCQRSFGTQNILPFFRLVLPLVLS